MTDVLRFLSWYLIITLVGWAAFPLAYRTFGRLPDRGYALARALGWLVWGYLFWALGSLGFLQNDLGGELLALLLVAVFSAAAVWGKWRELWQWIRDRRKYIFSAEAVFLAAFALLAVIRAANPTIDGTEKPMELAFLNAILKSPTFPPHDPWLSGYAISYYYFGYVLVTMLIRLSAVGSGVGFNLGIALLFGLTAVGAYGVLYDLLALRRRPAGGAARRDAPLGLPLFAPVFILLMGNLEGILAMLHDKGFFWTQVNGKWQSSFWSWLGVLELKDPPVLPLSWMPHYSFIPWWRASRVLADYKLNGAFVEVIDEFPFFSYLLSDLHPHVLAMPFAVLMIGLGLNVWLSARETASRWFGAELPFDRAGFLLASVLLGSLAFLNTWDFPIYVALVAGAYSLGRVSEGGWRWSLLGDFLRLALMVGIAGVILYLPFYVGFSSQAGGILPSMIFFTRGTQFWVMFATLLIPILVYLGYRLAHAEGNRADYGRGFGVALGLVAVLWVAMILFGVLASLLPSLGSLFMDNLGAGNASIGQVITASLVGFSAQGVTFPGRLTAPGAWVSLVVILGLVLAALLGIRGQPEDGLDARDPAGPAGLDASSRPAVPRPDAFWLLLVLVGALLVLAPEFFYLRDQFGSRMNTIFKFYFTAWMLWGLAAGYGTAVLLEDLGRFSGLVWRAGLVCLLAVGLSYAVWGLWTKTGGFQPGEGWTLDGNKYLSTYAPDDVAAVRWLDQQPPGVIAEAVGDSYHSETSRLATLSGYSTVLGWLNHEYQWRGTTEDFGSRQPDLQTLYSTNDWNTALDIIQRYQIRYIYIGPVERAKYQVNETKFQRNLPAPFQSGQDTIYTVPQPAPLVGQAPWNGGGLK